MLYDGLTLPFLLQAVFLLEMSMCLKSTCLLALSSENCQEFFFFQLCFCACHLLTHGQKIYTNVSSPLWKCFHMCLLDFHSEKILFQRGGSDTPDPDKGILSCFHTGLLEEETQAIVVAPSKILRSWNLLQCN